MKIILASGSPRRKEILSSLGISFEVKVSDADETVKEALSAEEFAQEVSMRKAKAVLKALSKEESSYTDRLIIAADTTVCCEGKILGKPKNKDEAREMIRLLSGKTHYVISGITVCFRGRTVSSCERTEVRFREIKADEIEAYISTDEPYDKAGGYGIQDRAAIFVKGINGDYLNVVGLPVFKLFMLLKNEFGLGYFDLT